MDSEAAEEIAHLSEQLIEAQADAKTVRAERDELQRQLDVYHDVVADVVRLLGHEGDSPDDLRDAVGQLDALLSGEDSLERNDLLGLAEQVRQALWDRDRARALRKQARDVCERRTAERDELSRQLRVVGLALVREMARD